MSNTNAALNKAADSRPSISELSESLPAITHTEGPQTEVMIPDDQIAKDALITINFEEDADTSISRKGNRKVDKTDPAVTALVNTYLDHTRKDGQTNFNALRSEGVLYITERVIPNLCDPDAWKALRESFRSALSGRGLHEYDGSSSFSQNTGSFVIGGSRLESTAKGTPQPYPRTMRLSIIRFAENKIRENSIPSR